MRMNISVNDDLKKRMDKVDGVNWSAIASAAFLEIVNSREREKEGSTMDNVIERLKLSATDSASECEQDGRDCGRGWASNEASALQLKRLDRARDSTYDWYFGSGSSAYTSAEHFFFIIEPNSDGDREAAAEFWEMNAGHDNWKEAIASNEFVQAFAVAAVDLWNEVKRKL